MKKLFLVALVPLLNPVQLNAEDTADKYSITNSLTNPFHKPNDGEFRVMFDANYYKREYNLENNTTKAKISDRKEEGILVTENLRYGITDRWSFDFSVMYDHYTDHNTPVAASTQEYDYSGFENPEFGFTYRAMDNKGGKIDLSLSFAPDIFDRELTTDKVYEGAPANGRHELEFFTRYGQSFRHFAIALTGKTRYLDTAEYQRISDKSFFRESKRMRYEALLETEYKIYKKFTMNTNVGYIWNTESDLENHNTALVQKKQQGDIFYTKVQANIAFKDFFTLSAYYEYQNFEETYLKYKSGPATADTVREEDKKDIYGIATVFMF